MATETLPVKVTGEDCDVLNSLRSRMEQCLQCGRINSYYRFRSTLRAVKRHCKTPGLPLNDITPLWLRSCERNWRDEGLSDTTINIYMRTLKCAVSDLIRSGNCTHYSNPFGRGLYQVPSPHSRKLALTRDQIDRLAAWKGPEALERERDLWLFSYLCNGINFRDMLFLRRSNLVGGEIEFIRAKTRGTREEPRIIRAAITPQMMEIMKRQGKRCGQRDDYIFPFAHEGMTPMEVAMLVRKETGRCNRALKVIAAELGIPPVTTYTARHSFATVLKRQGVDITYISESLGHSNVVVTQTYLSSFERSDRARFAALLTGGEKK